MRTNLLVSIFIPALVFFSNARGAENLKREFARPSNAYRIGYNTHGFPDQAQAQDALLDGYLSIGLGGLATNAKWSEHYMKSPEELASLFRFAGAAKARKMDVWLYDEFLYPSGMAGRHILGEHPEWEAEGLFFKDTTVTGGQSVTIDLLPGRPVLLKAVPVIHGAADLGKAQDLSLCVMGNKLCWDAPQGEWIVAMVSTGELFKGYQAEQDRHGHILRYTSLLMPEVTERFIEITHKTYADALDKPLSTLFSATFTDEPSSMAQAFFDLGYGVYPWKANLTREFEKLYGVALHDALLAIMLDDGPEGQLMRVRYFRLVADLMAGGFFRPVREFCHSQGIASGGHLLLEEPMLAHVPLYGDIMACFREMDIPGIDVLTAMPDVTRRYMYSGRLASSAAELIGKSAVMSEICPVADPDYKTLPGAEAKIRGCLNQQMIAGVTKFNNYLRPGFLGTDEQVAFNDYIARVAVAMSGGVRASRIAVYYPIETMWAHFLPKPTRVNSWYEIGGGAPAAQELEALFDGVSEALFRERREFSYIDARGIAEAAAVGKQLVHEGLKWDVVLLPGVKTLSLETAERLAEFAGKGGTVIAVGVIPENSTGEFPCARVQEIFSAMQKSGRLIRVESPGQMDPHLETLLKRDLSLDNGENILTAHRLIDGYHVWLIANDSNQAQEVGIRLQDAGPAEIWDPFTGKISPLRGGAHKAELAPYGALIVRKKL